MDTEEELFLKQLQKGSPLNLGHKIVYFKVADCQQTFAVHEDLICTSSYHFDDALQNKRELIEGECLICHEAVNVTVANITFCRKRCGRNFHEDCIVKWIASQQRQPKCPLCQCDWADPVKQPISLDESLDQQAVTVYIDWLYTRQLRLTQRLLKNDNESHLFLLKAWKVADFMRDGDFENAISDRYTELYESKEFEHVDIASIRYAFEDVDVRAMKDAVVLTAVERFSKKWYNSIYDELPIDFRLELRQGLWDLFY